MNKLKNTKIYEFTKNFIKNNYKELIFLIVLFFLAFYNFPYVIYKPGGSINLSDRIAISDASESDGSYNMSYVSVSRGNLPSIIASFLIKDWDLVKETQITYENTDYETTFKLEQLQLKNSLDIATIVAYNKAGKNIEFKNQIGTVLYIDENAKTNIKVLDEIISINNIPYASFDELRELIVSLNVGDKVSVKVTNSGKEHERYAFVYELEGRKLIGISLIDSVDYEVSPKIDIATKASEAGPSGGLMLSLAIYDLLIDADLTHGKTIMGTGTMDINENVGAIGGVKYKMLGAENDGADIFFIPKDNYDEAKEVYEKYDLNFELVMVETFDEAINYLNSLK